MPVLKRSLVALLLLAPMQPAHAAYGPAQLLFTIKSAEIGESSGIEPSTLQADITWTHNDSPAVGDWIGRFYALGPTGFTVAAFQVVGSFNSDWEAMELAAGTDGGTSLYFADFGDNLTSQPVRPGFAVYEVPQPLAVAGSALVRVTPSRIHPVFWDGTRHNVETFMIDPRDGSFVVVTKEPDGHSGVFVAPRPAVAGGPRVLARVGEVDLTELASGSTSSHLNATGGDFAPDGSRIVVRTYVEAFEWEVGARTIAEAFAGAPQRIELPVTQQGEAIAYTPDSANLLTSSEGPARPQDRPVHLIPRA